MVSSEEPCPPPPPASQKIGHGVKDGSSLSVQIALVVAQCRERGGRLSGIKLSALSSGLQRVARLAHRKKGMKIPHMTLSLNWDQE